MSRDTLLDLLAEALRTLNNVSDKDSPESAYAAYALAVYQREVKNVATD
jgi:hypothetical protein